MDMDALGYAIMTALGLTLILTAAGWIMLDIFQRWRRKS